MVSPVVAGSCHRRNDRIEEMIGRAVVLGFREVVRQGVDVVGAGQGSEPTRSVGRPPPAIRRRRVRPPCTVTSSQVKRMTLFPASSRSASLAASRSRSRRVRWNSKPSTWTASRSSGQWHRPRGCPVSPSTRALKTGAGMWGSASRSAEARSSRSSGCSACTPRSPVAEPLHPRRPLARSSTSTTASRSRRRGPLRTVDRHREIRRPNDSTEVEQRASNARDRNAVHDGEVLRGRSSETGEHPRRLRHAGHGTR